MSGGKCWNSLFIPLGEVTVLGGCQLRSQPPGFTDMCHLWWRQLKSIWGILLSGSQAGGGAQRRRCGFWCGTSGIARRRRGTAGLGSGTRRRGCSRPFLLPPLRNRRCALVKRLEAVPASRSWSSGIRLGAFCSSNEGGRWDDDQVQLVLRQVQVCGEGKRRVGSRRAAVPSYPERDWELSRCELAFLGLGESAGHGFPCGSTAPCGEQRSDLVLVALFYFYFLKQSSSGDVFAFRARGAWEEEIFLVL